MSIILTAQEEKELQDLQKWFLSESTPKFEDLAKNNKRLSDLAEKHKCSTETLFHNLYKK